MGRPYIKPRIAQRQNLAQKPLLAPGQPVIQTEGEVVQPSYMQKLNELVKAQEAPPEVTDYDPYNIFLSQHFKKTPAKEEEIPYQSPDVERGLAETEPTGAPAVPIDIRKKIKALEAIDKKTRDLEEAPPRTDPSLNAIEIERFKNYGTTGGITKEDLIRQREEKANALLGLAGNGVPGAPNYDPDLKKTSNEVTAEMLKQIGYDQASVDALRNQRAQIDLTPLMALLDSGSNLKTAAGYTKPPTPRDLETSNIKLEDIIQKQRESILDNAQKQQYNRAQRAAADPTGKDARQLIGASNKLVQDAMKDVNKISMKYSDADSQLTTLKNLIATKDYRAIRQMLPTFAKFVSGTVGSQSDKDIDLQMAPSLVMSLTQLEDFLRSPGEITRMSDNDLIPFAMNIEGAGKQLMSGHQMKIKHLWEGYKNTATALELHHLLDSGEGKPGMLKEIFNKENIRSAKPNWWLEKAIENPDLLKWEEGEAFYRVPIRRNSKTGQTNSGLIKKTQAQIDSMDERTKQSFYKEAQKLPYPPSQKQIAEELAKIPDLPPEQYGSERVVQLVAPPPKPRPKPKPKKAAPKRVQGLLDKFLYGTEGKK